MKLTFTLIVLCFSLELTAQKAGTLDSSFGVDGKVLENFATLSPNYYEGLVIAEDKIIEIGSGKGSFGVVRYNADGSLDNSFGDSGFAVADLSFEATAWAYRATQQSSGKYILTGVGIHGFPDDIYDGLIIRLNDDGSIDPTFGVGGVIKKTSRKGSTASFASITVLPDNSFIVNGVSNGSTFINHFTGDGDLDQSFGQGGYVYLDNNFNVASCKLQSDGKIVLAGTYYYGGIPQFSLRRFLSDGSIDNSFGSNGIITTTNGLTGDILAGMAFQSDGKIVVTGTESYSFVVSSRYTVDGRLDSAFGINGTSSVKLSNMSLNAWGIVVTNNDEIIIGGTTESTDLFSDNYAIVKLKQNGIVDSSFGDSGQTITDFGDQFSDQILSIGLQHSGKIIAIGKSTNATAYYSSSARYNSGATKKQIIVQKIKHYIQTHNDAQATTLNNVSIYPNPAQNILHVEGLSSSQKTKLTVVDFNGNVAMSHELRAVSGVYNLNIASLHAGNYMLKIETNGEVVTKQFVKE